VCGEHEWVEGQCSNGPLVSTEEGKTFLEMGSESHKALRDIVMDRAWLKTLAFYVKLKKLTNLCISLTQIQISVKTDLH